MEAQERPDSLVQDVAATSHPNDAPNDKKRKTPSTSRGVSSLTPEQLAKKRANDREAQRAIRERTKAQIEGLERRIEELTSQQPYQELQAVLRQKELVQAENEEIKKRLASILSIIQPILGVQDSATEKSSRNTLPQQHFISVNGPSQPDHHTPSQSCSESSTLNVDAPSPSNTLAIQQEWNILSTPSQSSDRSLPPFDFQRNNLQHGLEFGCSEERMPLNILVDGNQRIAKVKGDGQCPPQTFTSPGAGLTQYSPSTSQSLQLPDSPFSAYSTVPQSVEPTCPLDTILLDFLHARQREAAEGASSQKLVGPAYPSVSSLLNPEKSVYSHPLSKVFTDVLSKFPDISELPEKVAVLYVMFLIMRWLVKPTKEHYERLPPWVRPTGTQLATRYPAWITWLPWPRMRDVIIANFQEYPFENFFVPYTTTISLNWPYEATDTLLACPSDSEELMINPVFERHLRDLNNWSLGEAFAKAHPSLASTCRIKVRTNRKNS